MLKILFFIFLYICAVLAQESSKTVLNGYVYSLSYKAVSGAEITLEPNGYFDITDSSGSFSIPAIPAGNYTLTIKHIGFLPLKKALTVPAQSDTMQLDPFFMERKVLQGDEIVVTASRVAKHEVEIAPLMNMVPRMEIESRQSKTSAEALREESGVFIQKTNHGGGSAIIRGLSSNQILILVDGIRLNNSTYRLGNHQYLTTVDPNALEQIEVVHGPLSVMYGSDALGGTINLISKEPRLKTNGVQGHFTSRYASADKEQMLRGGFSARYNNWVWSSNLSYKKFGDLKHGRFNSVPQLQNGGPIQKPTGYDGYDFSHKLLFQQPRSKTVLAWQRSQQFNVPRFDKYAYGTPFKTWLYTPQKRDLLYLLHEQKTAASLLKGWQARLSYHIQEEGRKKQKSSTKPLSEERDKVYTLGASLSANALFYGHNLQFGTDIYHDNVRSQATETENGGKKHLERGRYPDDASYSTLGIFLSDTYHFTPRWHFTAGLRFAAFYALLNAKSGEEVVRIKRTYKTVTPSFSLNYMPDSKQHIALIIARGFRAPNLSDIGKFGSSKGNVFEVPAVDINPETTISSDVTYKIKRKDWHLSSALYYMYFNDILVSTDAFYNGKNTYIDAGDTLKVKSKKNVGKAFIYGFELAVSYHFNHAFSALGNVTFTHGQNITANEPIGGIPPLFGLLGIKWQEKAHSHYLFSRFAAQQKRLSADDGDDPRIPQNGTPGWHTINWRSKWHFNKHVALHFSVENILDYFYREHGSGINAAGRNFIFALSLNF